MNRRDALRDKRIVVQRYIRECQFGACGNPPSVRIAVQVKDTGFTWMSGRHFCELHAATVRFWAQRALQGNYVSEFRVGLEKVIDRLRHEDFALSIANELPYEVW